MFKYKLFCKKPSQCFDSKESLGLINTNFSLILYPLECLIIFNVNDYKRRRHNICDGILETLCIFFENLKYESTS